jgi:DNA invertase Pin-like site-specific DNA recombinase
VQERAFVAYCRASSRNQTLSIAIQHQAIERYTASVQGLLLTTFEEVTSASPTAKQLQRNQPELVKALACARTMQATLLVARLDRLTRSVAVLAMLLEDGVRLVVAATPGATRMMLHMYAVLAEDQRDRMSRRVRNGIAAAKAAGGFRNRYTKVIAARSRRAARGRAAPVCRVVEKMRRGKSMTLEEVALELNRRGLRTPRGVAWRSMSLWTAWRHFHRGWSTQRFPGRHTPPEMDARTQRSTAHAEALRNEVAQCRRSGARSAIDIALQLNLKNLRTVTGQAWKPKEVRRLLRRLAGKKV